MHKKKVYERYTQASVHWSAARNEESSSSHVSNAVEPWINRWSNAGFVPPSVLHTNYTERPSEETLRTVFPIRWGARGRLVTGQIDPKASCPTQPHSGEPLRRAPPRRDEPLVCPGFGLERSFSMLTQT